jgi:hypothetical protein
MQATSTWDQQGVSTIIVSNAADGSYTGPLPSSSLRWSHS